MTDDTRHPSIPSQVSPSNLNNITYSKIKKKEQIGTGGDANVYRAIVSQNNSEYTIAVKEPRFEGTIQREVIERFEKEAETWANLDDHQNVVSVHGYGTKSVPWIALEYMDAGTLAEQIGDKTLVEGLWTAGRIAEGIRYGHRHGVAHLDIKPNNILLRSTPSEKWEYPKVSDWGLAKLLLEHSKSVEGFSPTYAAPEQFDTEEYGRPDDITDIYQFGTVVYALLTGHPPFTGSATDVMQSVLQKSPDPPSTFNSAIPDVVDEIVLKTLAKEKDNRYQGMLPLLQDIDQAFEVYINEQPGVGVESLDLHHDSLNFNSTESGTSAATTTTQDEVESASQADPIDDETSQTTSGILTRRAAIGLFGAGIVGSVGASQFISLSFEEQILNRSNSNVTETASPDSTDASDPRTEPVLSERWTGDRGADYIWSVGSDFYFHGFAGSNRARPSRMVWSADKNIENGQYHYGDDAFGYSEETVIFGFSADIGKERPYSQAGAHFYAYQQESGDEQWTLAAPDDGDHRRAIDATITEGVAALGCADYGGRQIEPIVYGVDTDIGDELWQNSYPERQLKSIVGYAEKFFLVFRSELKVIDPNTGTELETHPISITGKSVASGNSLFGIDQNVVVSYRLDEKNIQWRSSTIDNLASIQRYNGAMAVDNSNVFVGTNDGSMYGLSRSSGDQIWEESIIDEVSSIATSSFNVWVRNTESGVFALNRDNGEIVHRSTHGSGGGLAVNDDILILDGDSNIKTHWIEES